jgi:hypothetical protein
MLKQCKSDILKVFGLADNLISNISQTEDTQLILKEIIKEMIKHALNDLGLKIARLVLD